MLKSMSRSARSKCIIAGVLGLCVVVCGIWIFRELNSINHEASAGKSVNYAPVVANADSIDDIKLSKSNKTIEQVFNSDEENISSILDGYNNSDSVRTMKTKIDGDVVHIDIDYKKSLKTDDGIKQAMDTEAQMIYEALNPYFLKISQKLDGIPVSIDVTFRNDDGSVMLNKTYKVKK